MSDRQHRRPFRGAGKPVRALSLCPPTLHSHIWQLSFVPTEVGLQRHTAGEEEDSPLLSLGAALPPDIRRGLLELDWYRSESEKGTEKKAKWDRLPIATLPMTILNLIEYERAVDMSASTSGASMSAGVTPTAGLLSRKSSTGGSGGPRRRSVFVPLMASLVASLSKIALDDDPFIALLSRDLLSTVARDDPGLISRPLFDSLEDISGSTFGPDGALGLHIITTLHAALPPALSYHVFNHLAGYVKTVSRDAVSSAHALQSFAEVMPNMAQLANHVSDLSIRDLKRNKLEVFALPTFDLWFPPSLATGQLPSGPSLADPDRSERELIALLTIRSAQNIFLANFLRRFPKEGPTVRRGMSMFQLPVNVGRPIDAAQCVMRHVLTVESKTITLKSLTLSKSYLVLVIQLLRTYSPMSSDRAEISNLIDGVNLTMLVHGRDLGILGLALSAYLTASTRFRRLFISSSGYSLIMPPLLRVYSDAFDDDNVRAAIEYTTHRFLALHDKAFVFQALDAASQMAAHPIMLASPELSQEFSKNIYRLFASLHVPYRSEAQDTVGMRSDAQYQEKEALLTLLAEPVEAVLATGSRSRSQSGDVDSTIPSIAGSLERWHNQRFLLDDLVRLFLTIIAHAPSAKRAENFLKLLDAWVPYLYNGSASSRTVLQNGIEALASVIFSRNVGQRVEIVAEGPPTSPNPDWAASAPDMPTSQDVYSSSDSNPMVMRYDYIHLISEFNKSGGQLAFSALQRTFDAIKILVKDHGARYSEVASTFMLESTRRFLVREGRPTNKQVVAFLAEVAHLFRAHGDVLNISSVVETVTKLFKDPILSSDREFTKMVVDQFCRPAIEACSAAATVHALENWPARDAVSSLFAIASTLPDTKAISLVVQQPASAAYMAGFILPLCQRLPTSDEAEVDGKHRAAGTTNQAVVWRRILGFVMDVCQTAAGGRHTRAGSIPEEKEKALRHRLDLVRENLAILSVGVQIIKIIVLRGGQEIESTVPGVWVKLARFLTTSLSEANLAFAATDGPRSPGVSPSPSRTGSPVPGTLNRHSLSSDNHASSLNHTPRQRIRAFDYLLASVMHFVVIYRSPLIIQLRLWIREHIIRLVPAPNVKVPKALSPSPSLSLSPSFGSNPRDSRRVSSVFTKLRPHHSSHSPDASPFLAPQSVSLTPLDAMNLDRRPGFQGSPSSSLDLGSASRPIVHLGPVTMQAPFEASEENEEFVRGNRQSSMLTRAEVIQSAHYNVLVVLAWFGYQNDDSVSVKAWSRLEGIRAVREETKSLLLEFHESFFTVSSGQGADEGAFSKEG